MLPHYKKGSRYNSLNNTFSTILLLHCNLFIIFFNLNGSKKSHWFKAEERVVGADLGLSRFQFGFENEESIEAVLKMQPFHFDYWMVTLFWWKPKKAWNYPSNVTFWIRALGVSLEFFAAQTIVEAISEISGFHWREFHEGEESLITLNYEKLFGYCQDCFSLCHDLESLPSEQEESYKGVVIKSEESYQDKEQDQRRYHGKRKEKIVEKSDSKWVKASEGENKHSHSSIESLCGNHPKDMLKRIITCKFVTKTVPEEQVKSNFIQKDPSEVLVETIEVEDGVDLVNEMLEDGKIELGEDVMGLDEEHVKMDRKGDDENECGGTKDNEHVMEKGLDRTETERRQGAHKKLFTAGARGTTKQRFVQTLLSPRKHNATKHVTRQGGSSKHTEANGS
ncbi:hypothetical protein N665_0670s0006 [Sinapis alba]|nr:hypothetical protein N665_0670s0006 [Sinapis alba]